MPIIRYAVRRAKTASDRRQGKRFVAQAEFPGGRKIKLARTRTRPPAVTKLKQEVQNVVQVAITATGGANAGGSGTPNNGRGGNARNPGVRLE